MPTILAITLAVMGWSPVTIITYINVSTDRYNKIDQQTPLRY